MSITEDITGTVLSRLAEIADLLRDLIRNAEQEPDYDQTFCFAGIPAAGGVFTQFEIPRSIRHAEITLNAAVKTTNPVALIDGSYDGNTAGNLVAMAGGQLTPSGIIVASAGGPVTVRDFLGGSGWLTVYCAAATSNTIITVRIRSLDAVQARGQRT